MGGLNVKNTIVEELMEIVAPHPCCGCGKIGTLLCNNCKYNISIDPFVGCILCGRPQINGICAYHASPFESAIVASQRDGVVKALIDGLKFHNQKVAARSLAELLDERLPMLPEDVCIVPVPTVASHVRQRGYDQVDLIARQLAGLRGLPICNVLSRRNNATQHTAGRLMRRAQAQEAYSIKSGVSIERGATYLLLDDIITTGSTVTEAALAIQNAGGRVVVAALAYQPLEPRAAPIAMTLSLLD